MSNNTVKKHVDGLRKKGLIKTEYTTITTKDGRIHNGSLCYTLLPIESIEETYFQKMLKMENARSVIQNSLKRHMKKLKKNQKKQPKSMKKQKVKLKN